RSSYFLPTRSFSTSVQTNTPTHTRTHSSTDKRPFSLIYSRILNSHLFQLLFEKTASLKGWNLVVVGDRKTPSDWHLESVHFLSLEVQQQLGKSTLTLMFKNSYTRKNIGYLYAIQRGAKWIYDTDDDNKPYGGNNLFNPYRFFGHRVMWPRGFPLEHLRDHTNGESRLRLCHSIRTPAVQQGLVHKDPDVDAIYRLLYADKKTGLNERFNEFAPPIALSPGTYSPWNSQNTLFHRNAFFTLFLPVSVAFRVTDIWRSYFSQKLLHMIGERVAFYPVNAIQNRNAHNYLSDFEQETQTYESSGKLVEFLNSWSCSSTSITNCTIELAESFRLVRILSALSYIYLCSLCKLFCL
ncbi:unnamed protein product, partial [Heligmosomoides polygyrus]